ncbi:hypothetical protein DVT68_10550 [Dyella solisilvae]|uniref:Uncharacterized protein n=1 Tax=Dyella solisilvae TaxID=1920168 RepID=A0A370K908_9GAMM|nr:hypothetical protein [Dyella solisilvae]RDI98927.1 hypothetical protein DVT68_10550 [Dyella solisilvae]
MTVDRAFPAAKALLLTALAICAIGAAFSLITYLRAAPGPYDAGTKDWVQACSADRVHAPAVCGFTKDLLVANLRVQEKVGDANLRRETWIWHHVASMMIFFVVTGAFIIALYLAYLQFVREGQGVAPAVDGQPDPRRFVAKFFGMEFDSSGVGLSVLVMAFAFFLAYLAWVYPVTQLEVTNPSGPPTGKVPASAASAATTQTAAKSP